jgi:hypothetical protein
LWDINATGYSGSLRDRREFLVSLEYAFGMILPFAVVGFFYVDDDNFKKLLELLVATAGIVLLCQLHPRAV